ncbi:MAG: protein kinase [Myxococcales bacterium]|nr:protein kinase [Myxococcales bacterium]
MDGFEVVGVLGEGGTAEVWLARGPAPAGAVGRDGDAWALKILRTPDVRLAERMRAEAQAQRQLDHPNVVPVVALLADDRGRPVLCMPHVQGPTLAALLRARPSLSLDDVDALARGILAGVAAAHAEGWVHRDLKPSNVLLSVQGDGLVPQVADFGLAKLVEDAARAGTLTQHGAGTRRYMSLEQLSGRPVDPRMDVFALGAVLWELVEGRPAFEHTELWRKTVDSGKPPPLTRDVPHRMHQAIAAALALAADRPADATALSRLWVGDQEHVPRVDPSTVAAARELQAAPRPMVHAPTVATAPPPRRRWSLLLGTVLGAAVGLAWWWASPRTVEVSTPVASVVPTVTSDPAVQRRFALAWEQFADARLAESERTLLSLSQTTSDLPEVYLLLALNRVARGRYQGALDVLEQVQPHLAPDDERTRRMVAALERSMFRVSDADPWAQLVLDYPDDLMVQAVGCAQMGLRPEADAACARARAIDDLPVLSWVRGQWAMFVDDHATARVAIDEFLARSPNNPLGLLQDGWWHAAFSEWDEVEASAERALAVDASLAEARLLLAYAYAHRGDLAGRREQLALALGQTTSLPDRMQLKIWSAQASAGLGRIAEAEATLDEVSAEATEHGVWFWRATAAIERLQLALMLQDPERVASARVELREAAQSEAVAPPIAQRLKATEIYGQGREAALRGDGSSVAAAREQLLALDQAAAGWVSRDRAAAILHALERDQRGDPEALMDWARMGPGCEAAVRGGELLVSRGHLAAGQQRLRAALGEVCPQAGYSRYLRVVAREGLWALARDAGRAEEADGHVAALAALWPAQPDRPPRSDAE